MCPWVGPHAPSFGRQLWGVPSRVEYLSPQGVLLPLVYGTTASPLWLQLRGLSAGQETPSWTVYRLTCQRLLPWLRVTFAMVPDAAWSGSDQRPWGTAPAAGPVGRLGRPSAPDPWGAVSFLSLGRPTCARVCGVLGHLAPVHRCARWVRCFACAVSWATWLLFTSVPARCVALRVRCPGPLGSCSAVRRLAVLFCLCGVLGHLAPVHWCARSVCSVACAVSWATWLLFTGLPAWCVVLLVRCPGPLGSCSPVCPLGVFCCVCGVLGPLGSCSPVCPLGALLRVSGILGSSSAVCPLGALLCVCGILGPLAPVHRCARSLCCFAGAVSWATWVLFTSAPARCVALRVRCPGPLGSCSPVCPLGALPVCAVSWATWLLFTGVPARRVVLRVRCPGPPGSCSSVCPLGALFCLCGVLGHLAPVHQCARWACCVACAVSWATWLLLTGVPARCVACVCGVVGYLAPVHRCACSVRCFACVVSWATWLLFTGVPTRCVVFLVRCPGPLDSCFPVCPRGPLLCVSGVMGRLAPVHRCPCLVCCLCARCPGPPGSCSPLCLLGVLFCLCAVLGHLAPVHRCARSLCCFACAVSWATWLLFCGVPARCVVLRVRCPGPLGSCSPVCPLGALFCLCGVLGHLAPVHWCGCSVRCFACAESWATWLLFTGVPPRCVALRVPCPGPIGSCSPVCPLGALLCVCGVLGHLAPVHQCAHAVCCFACAVSWATWLLFTGVPAGCVVLRVRCPGPLGSC